MDPTDVNRTFYATTTHTLFSKARGAFSSTDHVRPQNKSQHIQDKSYRHLLLPQSNETTNKEQE